VKGHVEIESLRDQIVDDTEVARVIGCQTEDVAILRKQWISNFVSQGGFFKLLTLLKDIQ
jgi:hypothetical protein